MEALARQREREEQAARDRAAREAALNEADRQRVRGGGRSPHLERLRADLAAIRRDVQGS